MTTFGELDCGDEFIAALNGNMTRFIKISARTAKFFDIRRGKFQEIRFLSKTVVVKVS